MSDKRRATDAYTLMSNHVHLLMQAPTHHALGRPLRWFMTETARAFHQARERWGHFWERRRGNGTGHHLRSNYLICLMSDFKSWHSAGQVDLP